MTAADAALHLGGRLDRTDIHAGPAFQAELHVNKRTVLHKADGRPRAQIHAPAAPNTFFPVNANHPDLLPSRRPRPWPGPAPQSSYAPVPGQQKIMREQI